jgi:hypothetical protein
MMWYRFMDTPTSFKVQATTFLICAILATRGAAMEARRGPVQLN